MKRIIITAALCLLPFQAHAGFMDGLTEMGNSLKDATIGDTLDAKVMFDFELPADYIHSEDYKKLSAEMCKLSVEHSSYEIHVAANRETFLKSIQSMCYGAADVRAKGNKFSREKYMPKILTKGKPDHVSIFRRGI